MFEILPAIDLRGGQCVRLKQGDYAQETVFSDDPGAMAARWAAEGATRLHLVDLDGAKQGAPANLDAVRAIMRSVGIPCQLGGGVRSEESIRLLLEDVGIDRVIIGTQALKQPEWFREMTEKFPSRIVLGIDARDSMVATEGWLDVSQTSALELARQYVELPIAAIIYTNIANDGMMQGVDAGTLSDLAQLADLGKPVIASGGVTNVDDVVNLKKVADDHPQLAGAIIGRSLYEGQITVADAVSAAK